VKVSFSKNDNLQMDCSEDYSDFAYISSSSEYSSLFISREDLIIKSSNLPVFSTMSAKSRHGKMLHTLFMRRAASFVDAGYVLKQNIFGFKIFVERLARNIEFF